MSIKVFYCYAREDKAPRATLEKHLGNLKRQELITGWSDRDIDAGKEWVKAIDYNLNTANIILLLISPDFMHSEYCYSVEMMHALERHKNGTARVIPIILRPVEYEGAPFSGLQSLPTDAIPVTDRKWRTRDEAFLDIAQGIRKVVKELLSEQYVYEGNIYFYREQYEDALKTFERAIALDRTNASAYVGQGETLCQLISKEADPFLEADGRDKKALAAFEQAICLDKANARAYVGKAKALFTMAGPFLDESETEQMLEALERASSLDPKNVETYTLQGDIYFLSNRYEYAVIAYEKAIEVSEYFNRYASNRKGDALYSLGRFEEALDIFDRVLQEMPPVAFSYKGKGDALYHLGRYKEALCAYERAIAFNYSDAVTIYIQKGKILYQLNRHQEALAAYDQAVQLGSTFQQREAYKGKGTVLQTLAQEALKKAGVQVHYDPFLPEMAVKVSEPGDPFLPDFPDE